MTTTEMFYTENDSVHNKGFLQINENNNDNLYKNKTIIPLVTHIITDDDIGGLKGEKLKPIDLNRVIKILTDQHYASLYDRHIDALKKMRRHYAKGFFMKDLIKVCQILITCADRIEENFIYIDPLIDLLKICALPFIKEKSSDEFTYQVIAIELVSQWAYLMRVKVAKVQMQICQTLMFFYCGDYPPLEFQHYKQTSAEYNRQIVEMSDAAETLVKSLRLLDNELGVRLAVIGLLQQLSRSSAACCGQMLFANGAYWLCSHLMDVDPSGEQLFRSVEVLWNFVEHCKGNEVARQLSDFKCISQLREAFLYQLPRSFSNYDRQLRNDLLVLASLIASCNQKAPFIETGFLKQITLLATFQEVKSHNPLVRNLKLNKNHEDFELKKLLLNIIVILSDDSSVLPILTESHILLALFTYVRETSATSKPQEFSPACFEELQLHAMAALTTLGPRMIDDYMQHHGNSRLLLLLEWCTGPTDFGGHGNSFHGVGGRGNKRAQMRHCLRLMHAMVNTKNDDVIVDLVDQGAIALLTNISSSVSVSEEVDDAIDVEMQCDMLFILSALCEGDIHRKELYGTDGVENLIRYLKINPNKFSNGLGHHKLMIATVDCIWCCVVGCFILEDYFLEKEGIFLLLDLLYSTPTNMHFQLLGCLLDLAENEKTLGHITTWRSKDGDKSAPHFLCHLWREEEKRLKVVRQTNGALADLRSPLMGIDQRNSEIVVLPANCPSRAIVDVSENLRAKIYSLFCKIGYIDLPEISVEDHVTLTIIERYLDFKMGEVWLEIQNEMDIEDIRPISPDIEAIEWIGRCIEEESLLVAKTQAELLEAKEQQDLADEQDYYSQLRDNHRQKEKAISDFEDFIGRTSNYDKLRLAKQRQFQSIEASRLKPKNEDDNTTRFHSLETTHLQTTVFCNKLVTMESTPVEILGGHLEARERLATKPLANLLSNRSAKSGHHSVELIG